MSKSKIICIISILGLIIITAVFLIIHPYQASNREFEKQRTDIIPHAPAGIEVTLNEAFQKVSEYDNLEVNVDLKRNTIPNTLNHLCKR